MDVVEIDPTRDAARSNCAIRMLSSSPSWPALSEALRQSGVLNNRRRACGSPDRASRIIGPLSRNGYGLRSTRSTLRVHSPGIAAHAAEGTHVIRNRRISPCTLVCRDAQRTVTFYRDLLGLQLGQADRELRPSDDISPLLWRRDWIAGYILTFFEWPDAPRGRYGVGGIHHIALKTEDDETLLKWKRRLIDPACRSPDRTTAAGSTASISRIPMGRCSKSQRPGRDTI